MENSIYTVDYFIKKFEAIPEYEIGKGCISNHCALYHVGFKQSCYAEAPTSEAIAFGRIMGMTFDSNWSKVYSINDGFGSYDHLPTPKQRIIAALYDIRKLQQPEATPEPKVEVKTVYVTVDEKVRELQNAESIFQN